MKNGDTSGKVSTFQAVLRGIRHIRWFEWLHHIYVVLSLIGMGLTALNANTTVRDIVFISFFGLYVVVLLIFVLFSMHSNGQKSKYAEAMKCISDALDQCKQCAHYLQSAADNGGDVQVKKVFCIYLQNILTAMREAFSLTSSTSCRTSFKMIKKIDSGTHQEVLENLYVLTYGRDSLSAHEYSEKDRCEDKTHVIADNTDLTLLYKRNRDVFISGNVNVIDNYESTYRDGQNQLDYKSAIVWPVRYLYSNHDLQSGEELPKFGQELCAFLTVDSNVTNAFSERFDVKMGNILADALYGLVKSYERVVHINNAEKQLAGTKDEREETQ